MQPWHYDPPADLDQPLIERLRRFPREPDMLVFGMRWLTASVLRSWLRLYHRLTIAGRDNLPLNRSFVMVANHTSHLDALCLLAALPMTRLHRAFPAAAQDFFFVNGVRTLIAAVVANALPVDRGLDPRHSLEVCAHVLAKPGNILIVFPEGTRSRTGALGDFKPGVGLLVAGTDTPVVPCYLDGAFSAWPRGAWLPRPRAVRLAIGAPVTFADRPATNEWARRICHELRDRVLALGPAGPRHAAAGEASQFPRAGGGTRGRWVTCQWPVCHREVKSMTALQVNPSARASSQCSEHTLRLRDGTDLFYRTWRPATPTARALLLFHRGHEHSGRWDETVAAMALDDVTVFAWDQRGHGHTTGKRGAAPDLATVIRDADEWARHLTLAHGIDLSETIASAASSRRRGSTTMPRRSAA
jgi:1-acyl-sn-glycerol-3-phosphate acyltransferase